MHKLTLTQIQTINATHTHVNILGYDDKPNQHIIFEWYNEEGCYYNCIRNMWSSKTV